MILGDPRQRTARRRAGHARRSVPPGGHAPAGRHRAVRSAQPLDVHRRRAAPTDLRAGRPYRLGDRRPAAPARTVDRCSGRPATAEHGRKRARAAWRAARRADRGAAAAAVAPRRRRGRAQPRRRAKAIITSSRIGATDHCEIAREVAADVFPIRYVCSFGEPSRRGDPARRSAGSRIPARPPPQSSADGHPAAHVAVVTFEVTADGLMAVARNHMELLAGGARGAARMPICQKDAAVLATCANNSFAGLATGTVPWLLTGGTLAAPSIR